MRFVRRLSSNLEISRTNGIDVMDKAKEKELWVRFACAALSGVASTADGEFESECEIVAEYADEMVKMYKETFEDE